ncbi:oxidized low-density lipoprotein receptor 1-like isoform X2 [Hemitrygon akajei]|uniref:oxidized low-density lipoprotein receptor 1-like isoform X2 n=1 Tax=Hemitrygon akajei TaxID=2704970 RepID=UPI003BF9C25D
MAPRPGRMSMTAQAGPHKQEPNENIGNRPDRKIWLLCLVTFVLFVTMVALSIHVSQIPQSLKRMNSDLRNQFTEMETKYRSVNETKAQICELLTSRREQTCSKDWIRNEDLCYLISSFKSSYEWAKQLCSIADSKLLEINSDEEENFFNNRVRGQDGSYWIGTCKAGEAASNVVYKVNTGKFECGECKSWFRSCNNDEHRFICEKSASLCLDIPVKIRDLCQQPVELT